MNRTRLVVMLLAALVLAAGCGKDEEKNSAEITLWHIMNYEGPREVLQAAVDRFEARQDAQGETVHVQVEPFENDAFKTKLSVEIASGTPPSVFFTWGGGALAMYARAGKVADLSEALSGEGARERFLPAALDVCTVDSRVYALPLDLSCVPLWYNTALFKEHDLAPPRTFEELLAVCRALRARGITPLALGNRDRWPGAFYFIYLANRLGGTRLFLDAAARKAGAGFDDPAFVDAGRRLQQLVGAEVFPSGFNGIDAGQARDLFFGGKAAMILTGTWLVARAQTDAPDFLPHLGCISFPMVGSGNGDLATMLGGVNCGFAVSSPTMHQDIAKGLVLALTDVKTAEAWCRTGRIPAVTVSDEALATLPAPTGAARALLTQSPGLQIYYDRYLPPELAEVHLETTQALFAWTMTPEEAASAMEAAASNAATRDE